MQQPVPPLQQPAARVQQPVPPVQQPVTPVQQPAQVNIVDDDDVLDFGGSGHPKADHAPKADEDEDETQPYSQLIEELSTQLSDRDKPEVKLDFRCLVFGI